jgi:two-component system alkaline phosphatase synthesis response regulator PhoP
MKPDATLPSGGRILVVEDEPEMEFLLRENLEYEGFDVTVAGTGEEALAAVAEDPFALVVLDVMLPGLSGFAVCRELRSRGVQTPIIMLTARAAESDRVMGLDLGADDYVAKPFGVRELLARVRAQLRRGAARSHAADAVMLGDVCVDLRQQLVTRRGRPVDMSTREFELLRYFLSHRGEVVSREQLLRDVWGYNQVVVTRTVDTFVAKLRCHIEPVPHEPRYLVTVHGTGYRLVV